MCNDQSGRGLQAGSTSMRVLYAWWHLGVQQADQLLLDVFSLHAGRLLRQGILGSYPRKRILQICQSLRILNVLRAPNVGLPLTLAQLDALGAPVLVSRLVNARRHLLALRIAEMLNLDTDKVRTMHLVAEFEHVLAILARRTAKMLNIDTGKVTLEDIAFDVKAQQTCRPFGTGNCREAKD